MESSRFRGRRKRHGSGAGGARSTEDAEMQRRLVR